MITPFTIHVDDATLGDLHDRLARARIADSPAGAGWSQGTPSSYLRALADYWRDGYDWRAQESLLNSFPQYTTAIGGHRVHFAHARSTNPGALPLLLLHGWPGSFVEFLDVIPRLTDEFHVVVPSLPGYAFSEAPRTLGWNVPKVASVFAELMARLGYRRYGAQGGDWGAQVATRIAAQDPEHCCGLHLNMAIVGKPADAPLPTDDEQLQLRAFAAFTAEESGYALEQGTKPQTVGAALDDSPVGLLAWIVEKLRAWSDCDGDPERAFTRDKMLTNVMLYWITQSATSSARFYWELRNHPDRVPYVSVPTGIARYPKEVLAFPRSWVEAAYHVTHWAELPRGGHFAAWEQPELFADDVRTFFATVR